MSALVGVFGPDALSARGALPAMLERMQNRATDEPEYFESPEALIVARRHRWEADLAAWSGPLLIAADDWVIAADASLYYLADLRRRLEPRFPNAPKADSAELLLAGFRTWGHHFGRHVEGDYSLIAYDRLRKNVLLLRDFGGRRGLVWTVTGDGTVVVASSPLAAVEHPKVSRAFDVTCIAAAAAAIEGHGTRTAFAAVSAVRAGTTLMLGGRDATVIDRWDPPPFGSGWEEEVAPDAAEKLRGLLEDATRERLQPGALNAVWMSGGWDSPAVFAAGRSVIDRGRVRETRLLPISMTYPKDDTGNEDDHIRAIAAFWNSDVRWVDTSDISLDEDADRRAAVRDDPFSQPSESLMRRLCRETRLCGTRWALDGFGGDHLFHLSTIAVRADHLFYGRWPELWRSWRAWGASGRDFVRGILLPHLSPVTRRWLGELRGRPIAGFWDYGLPDWIVRTPELAAELEPEIERRPGEGAAEFESRRVITTPFRARAVSWNHVICLEEGVSLTSPLFDVRLIAFAASRPLSDRGCAGDSKRVLRRAMSGFLPDSLLAARKHKSGTTVGYTNRKLQESDDLRRFFAGSSRLERLGVLDGSVMRSAMDNYASSGRLVTGPYLLKALDAERWLAAHAG